jgi:hypothetical protein
VRIALLLGLLACCGVLAHAASSERAGTIAWREWSPALFPEAVREHRFVLLDLAAVWCHCHTAPAPDAATSPP